MCNKGKRCLSKAIYHPSKSAGEHEPQVGDFYCSRNHSHQHGGDHHELMGLRREVTDMRSHLQILCNQLASAGVAPELTAQCLLQVPNISQESKDSVDDGAAVEGRRLQGVGECCCCHSSRHNTVFKCDPDRWTGQNESGCPSEPDGTINAKCSEELQCRWQVFAFIGGPHEEVEEHEEMMSTSYKLFETWGTAASVEMYFTICGVLLKVILLTQHPKSDEILDLAAHHHVVDHKTGEHQLVEARPGSTMGTVTKSMGCSCTGVSPTGIQSNTDPTEAVACSTPAGAARSSSIPESSQV